MQEGQGGSEFQAPEQMGAWSALPAGGDPARQPDPAPGSAESGPAAQTAGADGTGQTSPAEPGGSWTPGVSWPPAPAPAPPAAGWAGTSAGPAQPGQPEPGQPPLTQPQWAPPPGGWPPATQWGTPPGGQPPWGPPPPGYAEHGGSGQPPQRPRRAGRALIYGLVIALAAGAGAVGATLATGNGSSASPGAGVSPQEVPAPNANVPSGSTNTSTINTQAVADKVDRGVVDITAKLHYTGQTFEGTGMVLSASGLVLTNNHVVAGSTHLTATLVTSGRRYTATVVGTDATHDVALLKLEGASGLTPVAVGDSARVRLGTQVVAIGNAGGTGGSPTVTSGSITALNRTITASDAGSNTSETLHGMLQTNAPIAEGDSGGPLSNAAGQVVGMDTAANTQTLGGSGTSQGFAIPINQALAIARQMAAGHGNADVHIGLPPFLGVELSRGAGGTPDRQWRQLQAQAGPYGSVNSNSTCLPNEAVDAVPGRIAPASSGTLIAGVLCGTPAMAAGLTGGDVIIAVNGQTISTPGTLTKLMITHYHPGNTISVTWLDLKGSRHTASIKLIGGPAK